MHPTPERRECASLRGDLAALATGTLAGGERAEVLDHLERCATCTIELEELSATVDALMTLVPEATPPEGFAERAVARWQDEARPPAAVRRRASRRRVLAVAAALAVAVGAGVGAGAALFSSGSGPGSGVEAATFRSASGAEGTVLLSPGPHGWLVMTIGDVNASGPVTCSVTLADGSHRVVGRFWLSAGYGSWALRLPVAASSVQAVELQAAGGQTIASAQLRA